MRVGAYNDYRMSKRQKAFSRLIFQPLQKAKNCFLLLYHCNRNRQIPFRNLLANQRFAVEILEFRLSIVVIARITESVIINIFRLRRSLKNFIAFSSIIFSYRSQARDFPINTLFTAKELLLCRSFVVKALSFFMCAQVADNKHTKINRYCYQGDHGICQKIKPLKG